MKVACVVSSFPKLSEKFILDQITGLLDRGCDVQIFADSNSGEPQVHSDFIKYNLADRTHYDIAPPANKIGRCFKAASVIMSAFAKSPCKVMLFCSRVLLGLEKSPLRKLCWAEPIFAGKFDIVHCHFGPNGNKAMILKKLGSRAKLLVTFLGYDVTVYLKQKGQDAYSELLSLGDMFTSESDATEKITLGFGCPPAKMIKLPMGVHLDKISFSERKVGPDGVIRLLSVGRLVEMKGREYAIRAVAKVLGNNPNFDLSIVGDGPDRPKLQQLIKDLGVEDNVHLLGWISSEQLDRLYQTCHIFVHPSVVASDGNMEGQGVVLVEAQAYGMPILATAHNAFTETVDDGQSGFLVPERDVDALVERLEYMASHQNMWAKMGQMGKAHAMKYDIEQLNDKLLNIYRDVLLVP
jgi:colanic acid/amylovoran biosynthesis glycosyltransferase